uniref:Ig-like domain-containing protein n=1 Tax=Seriola dumerili TaxID=41447 RepID=A0A3B4TNU7_SERDU
MFVINEELGLKGEATGSVPISTLVSTQTIASYSEVGGTLSLSPPFSEVITSILWKHDTDLVVEWVRNEMDYYGKFVGVATLDTTTARLEIKNMSKVYAGLYTVEINNQVQSQSYNVSVIKKVPKPEVAFKPLRCSPALDNCNLTCDGDTSEAGPVTYSWREGDGEVKTFSCQMKNPVSEKESEPQGNPFFQEISESSDGGKIAAGVIGLLAILGLQRSSGHTFIFSSHNSGFLSFFFFLSFFWGGGDVGFPTTDMR